MPDGSSGVEQQYGNYKLQQSFEIEYAPVKVSKWRSSKTGLTVVVGEHETPITNGHFTIASEIFDDTGRPHTLEHLIFLGSKSYPYKGVLDLLANRAGSNGTNAWTANDHTAYTISTAGTEGFLRMLPIYIDHVLHPTITDAGFVTEVHHINGKGEDAGVVYSEMQARENQAGDLIALETQRSLYPKSSAYRSETGGLMAMLRQLTAQQIRDYHAEYYVPYNLCLLIDGAVSLPELFEVLNSKVEPMILENMRSPHVPPQSWKRPFVETSTSSPLSIASSQTKTVAFMEQDESIGDIYMAFLGPSPTDYLTNTAIKILGLYLTDTSTSPLRREFVEIAKPQCTSLGIYVEDRVNKNEITFYMSDVSAKLLDSFGGTVMNKLCKIVSTEGIDMERMARVIRRDRKRLLNTMESGVSSALSDAVIGDFLYGNLEGKDLPTAFHDIRDYQSLTGWSEKEWLDCLQRWFTAAPSITIIGKPSAALAADIEKKEKDRLAKRREELGEEELKRLEKAVEDAKAESDTPPPPEMLTSFPAVNPSELTWIDCETGIYDPHGKISRAGAVQRHVDSDKTALPCQVNYAHVKSNFITVSVLIDTFHLPTELKSYMAILLTSMFNLGIQRPDGSKLSYEDVVDQLNDIAVGQSASLSYRSDFSETLVVTLKVEAADYAKAVEWIHDLLCYSVFDTERLSVLVARQLQELPYEKRNGNRIARSWANRLVFDQDKATSEAGSTLAMFELLPKVAQLLASDAASVQSKLEEIRKQLLVPSNVRVAVVGNILKLDQPKAAFPNSFLNLQPSSSSLGKLTLSSQTLSQLGHQPARKLVVVPMASIEGGYAVHFAKGPQGWSHQDIAAMNLTVSTLNAAESYLWKAIRGSGLAYGCYVEMDRESGLVGFVLYRSPDPVAGFTAAAKLLRDLADGTVQLDQAIVEGAKASLAFEYADKSSTLGSAAATAFSNESLKEIGKDADQQMLKAVASVTLDDMRRILKTYFLPLFDPATAIGSVSVNSGKAEQIEKRYKELGFDVERRELPVLEGENDESSDGESDGEDSGDEASNDGMDGIRSP